MEQVFKLQLLDSNKMVIGYTWFHNAFKNGVAQSPLRSELLSANNKESINLIGVNQYPRCPIAQVEFYRHVAPL